MISSRFGIVVLAAFLLAVLAYSAGAQSTRCPVSFACAVRPEPEGRDIRSFHAEVGSSAPVELFTVPSGQIFIVTDVLFDRAASGVVYLLEGGGSGQIKGAFATQWLLTVQFVNGVTPTGAIAYSLRDGIRFDGGTSVTLVSSNPTVGVTVSGHVAPQ